MNTGKILESLITSIALVFLAGCTPATLVGQSPSNTTAVVTTIPTKTIILETSQPYTPEPANTLTPSATTAPSPSEASPLLPVPQIHEQPGDLYETIIQIPVGENGILYRGAGVVDMEPIGPNGLVVTTDGVFIIGDAFGNRLLRYDLEGTRLDDIDLTPLDILNISDMVGAGEFLYILEISFKTLPERYRVNQITTDGDLVYQHDLPKGFHLEDGLCGLAIGYSAEGQALPLVELRGERSNYFMVPDSANSPPQEVTALSVYGRDLRQQSARPGEVAVLGVGEKEFRSMMTEGGMVNLLSGRPDGSLYLQREDVVAWNPYITTDITIHFISSAGEPLGVARYPIMDWYFYILRFLTLGPDGNVYGLITREKSVDVLRLNFYRNLEPLLPQAAKPIITSGSVLIETDPL